MNFYDDPVKVDEYETMCEQYDGSELYKVLGQYLPENSTMLELGSGPGNDVSYFRGKYKVSGSDMSDEFLRRCRKKYADVPFIKLDAILIKTDETFDCVFSNKVLHHFTEDNLRKSFSRQQQIIVKNGIFAHTFWLGDKEFTMEGMLFLFHNRENLINLVSDYFTVIQTYDYKEFEEGDSIFIVAKNDKTA